MKVKIVKASKPAYWYANNIGETFEVDDIAGCYGYNVINNPNFTHHYIQQRDCEIISEPVKIPFTFSAWDKDRSQKVWTRDGRVVKDVFYCPNRGSEYKIGGIIESELNMFRDNLCRGWLSESPWSGWSVLLARFDIHAKIRLPRRCAMAAAKLLQLAPSFAKLGLTEKSWTEKRTAGRERGATKVYGCGAGVPVGVRRSWYLFTAAWCSSIVTEN